MINCGRYCIRIPLRRSSRAVRTSVELLLVAFDTQLKVFHTPLDDDASCEHSKRDVKSKAFFDCQISQLSLDKKQQHIFDVLNAYPFEITFLELVKLIIVSSHRYTIQVLMVMPLDNLEFSNSDDSSLRIHITSRLPVNNKTVELLTFTPPMGDSPEVSCGALADSGSFPSLRLLDPQSDPAEGSSSLSTSSSRRLFNVTISPYVSKMILSDSYASTGPCKCSSVH
nr:hypothetical protein [Tanacetum cinerariifolium]